MQTTKTQFVIKYDWYGYEGTGDVAKEAKFNSLKEAQDWLAKVNTEKEADRLHKEENGYIYRCDTNIYKRTTTVEESVEINGEKWAKLKAGAGKHVH